LGDVLHITHKDQLLILEVALEKQHQEYKSFLEKSTLQTPEVHNFVKEYYELTRDLLEQIQKMKGIKLKPSYDTI
jgi:hypothetical protein